MFKKVSTLKPTAKEIECCQKSEVIPSGFNSGSSNDVNTGSPR